MTHFVLEDFRNQWFFSDSIAIDLDQIEAEVENEGNEEEVNFEVNWRNDFEELEKALEDDSGELELFFLGCTRLSGPDRIIWYSIKLIYTVLNSNYVDRNFNSSADGQIKKNQRFVGLKNLPLRYKNSLCYLHAQDFRWSSILLSAKSLRRLNWFGLYGPGNPDPVK